MDVQRLGKRISPLKLVRGDRGPNPNQLPWPAILCLDRVHMSNPVFFLLLIVVGIVVRQFSSSEGNDDDGAPFSERNPGQAHIDDAMGQQREMSDEDDLAKSRASIWSTGQGGFFGSVTSTDMGSSTDSFGGSDSFGGGY